MPILHQSLTDVRRRVRFHGPVILIVLALVNLDLGKAVLIFVPEVLNLYCKSKSLTHQLLC